MSQSRKHCDVCGRDGLPQQEGRGNRYKRHPECRLEARRRSQRQAYKENSLPFRRKTRATSMGITLNDLDSMYERAGGACEICGIPESEIADKYGSLAIDHDHSCCPGKRDSRLSKRACGRCVRGLLCPRCNKLLTLADQVTFTAIENYLRRHDVSGV